MSTVELPDSPEMGDALALLDDAYRSRLRREGRSARHPIAVAGLLQADGQPPPVVLMGLLHDVLEDTDVSANELRDRFGPLISHAVEALTQDSSIPDYGRRKAALRQQILAGGPDVAAVSLADKVAKLQDRAKRPPTRKLRHYRATLQGAEERCGTTPLSVLLRGQLERWTDG